MRPPNKYEFKVYKPPLTDAAMCVYRMTFSNGYYYIGGTSNLGNRITKHLIDLSKCRHTTTINKAFYGCNSVTFEFIEFINDRNKLNERENFHLSMNVGLSKCLNKELKSYTIFGLNRGKVTVVMINDKNEILQKYLSIVEAATSVNCNVNSFRRSVTYGRNVRGYSFRFLDSDDRIIEPTKVKKKPPYNCRKINQFDLSMNLLNTFDSLTEAERATKVSRRTIQTIAVNKQKSSSGFIFKYLQHSKEDHVQTL